MFPSISLKEKKSKYSDSDVGTHTPFHIIIRKGFMHFERGSLIFNVIFDIPILHLAKSTNGNTLLSLFPGLRAFVAWSVSRGHFYRNDGKLCAGALITATPRYRTRGNDTYLRSGSVHRSTNTRSLLYRRLERDYIE